MLDMATEAIRMCESIALRLGEDQGFNRTYDDGKIRVIRSMHSREMTVVIFPPFTGATTGNPALMVDECGRCFRTHGEIRRAMHHILDVYRTIPGNEDHEEGS
jgi:hypothetical protein